MAAAGDGARAEASWSPDLRCRLLCASVALGAATAVVSTTALALHASVAADPFLLAFAAIAFAATQLARIRFRVGSDVVMLAWGEVGIIATLCLVPVAWAPAVIAAGATIGHLYRALGVEPAQRSRVYYSIWLVTAGGAMASLSAAALVGSETPVHISLDRPLTFVTLILAALVHFLVTSLLVSSWVALATQDRVDKVWRRAVHNNHLMLLGNIAVGLAVAAVIAIDVRWLTVLAPILVLIHQVYMHQVRITQERSTWVALADATRSLNQLDEREVAAAALTGSIGLFGPEEAEVVLYRPAGRRHGYLVRASDLRRTGEPASVVTTLGEELTDNDDGQVVVRRLVVGGSHLGELRLRFRRRVSLGGPEQHAFSTFADALASALHDAATHRHLQAMTARSAYDAVHDTLTRLSNRSALIARGNAEIGRLPPASPVALVLLDVNRFREVNETLGHAAGDHLLQAIAGRLADEQTDGEVLGRLGGDEFAVLLTGVGATEVDETGAPCWAYPIERARTLTSVIALPVEVAGVTIAVEASAGVVIEAAGGCDMTELIRRAELALHQAKREGAWVARYDAANDACTIERLALLADLRDALATTDQLIIQLLPCVDLRTSAPVGAEVLVRWQHPRRGLLAPADFLDAVEHSELALGLTRYVLDMAVSVAATWAERGIFAPVSVNLGARCMRDPQLPERVLAMLASHNVAADRLILEVTERVSEVEYEMVEPVLVALRAAGVQISLDDFGTGAASLAFLTRFALDEVKIDRAFVSAMADSPETAAIIRATVELARELGLRVVAEGVEHDAQRVALAALGVAAAQGFLFHRPMGLAEATEVMRGAVPAR